MLALRLITLRIAALLSAAALSLTTAHAGDLIRVAGDGSGDYVTVASAVAAAADGDTLLITSPPLDYRVVLDGKGVTVIVVPQVVWEPARLIIMNLPASSTAVVRGFYPGFGAKTTFTDCIGSIVVTDSDLVSTLIVRCSSVSFARCESYGGRTPTTTMAAPAAGMVIEDSSVLMTSCEVRGWDGSDGYCGSGFCQTCCENGQAGVPGLTCITLSRVRMQSCVVRGGYGGSSGSSFCPCTDGAVGISFFTEPTSELTLLDTQTMSSSGSVGSPNILTDLPRSIEQPSSVEGGTSFQLKLHGTNGDTAFLQGGGVFVHRPQTLDSGILQVDQTVGRRRVGTIPPTGELIVTLTAPPVLAGEVLNLALQAVLLQPSGSVRFVPADIIALRGAGVPAW